MVPPTIPGHGARGTHIRLVRHGRVAVGHQQLDNGRKPIVHGLVEVKPTALHVQLFDEMFRPLLAPQPEFHGLKTAQLEAIANGIPPTSNLCERRFSNCKLVLLLPANFEMIMFMRANRELLEHRVTHRCD